MKNHFFFGLFFFGLFFFGSRNSRYLILDVPVDLVFKADDEELNVRASFYRDTNGALREIYATRGEYDPCVYTSDVPLWWTRYSRLVLYIV